MYLDGQKIIKIMRKEGMNYNQFASLCNLSSRTIWCIVSKKGYNCKASVGMAVYKALKVEGVISHPAELLDITLMDKLSIQVDSLNP